MIKVGNNYIAVYTKYDTLPVRINEPYFRDIITMPMAELSHGDTVDYKLYDITNVEDGLEGVKFVHYEAI